MQNELRCWGFCMIYPWSMPEHQWWCVELRSVQTVVVRCYLLECGTAGPGPTPSPRLWPGHHWPRRRWSWAGCLQSAVWSPAITRTNTTSHHQLITTQLFNTLLFKRLKTKQNVLVEYLWECKCGLWMKKPSANISVYLWTLLPVTRILSYWFSKSKKEKVIVTVREWE